MAAGILPVQRPEKLLCEGMEISTELLLCGGMKPVIENTSRHEEIRRLSSSFVEQHPQVFQPFLFSSSSVEEHEEKQNYWNLERKIAASKISNLSPAQ